MLLGLALFFLFTPAQSLGGAGARIVEIQGTLQKAEYHFASAEQGIWSAPNRSQGLRSRVSAAGLEVFPRETDVSGDGAAWKLTLRTIGLGREEECGELGNARLRADGARLELDHGPLTEWFVNRPEGIEQGWTIPERPVGVVPLWIGLEVQGDLSLRIDEGRRSGVFVDGSGERRLLYRDLHVWDAEGRELEASLVQGQVWPGIRILDQGAVYPLTVDPVLTGPDWTADGDQTGTELGISVGTAGDVNNDGYSDVIVGARYYDNGEMDEGRAFVYLGSIAGLSSSAAWTAESGQAGAHFGYSVATAGDVNGDGYSDVIVGASNYENGEYDEGRSFVYLGSSAGPSTTPAWTAESNQNGATFGTSVATAGDVNNDGYSDVIVGAYQYGNGQGYEGAAFLYLGSGAGLASSPAWTAESNQFYALFGRPVSTAGDVNGDGHSDVIVGSFYYANGQVYEGRAFLYLGSGAGLSSSAAWTAESDQANASFGFSAAAAGDVNGDGYGDVIIGSLSYSNGETAEGRAFVYLGSSGGLSADPAWTAESDQDFAGFGCAVASAGDVNGDGYSDVIVGSYTFDHNYTNEGRVFLYLGSGSGPSSSPAWTADGGQDGAFFGYGYPGVAGAGDVNGDGFDDVIVGAFSYDGDQTDEGRAFLYLGSGQAVVVLDFETEDDFTTPLGNGQSIDTEFGNLVTISGAGANAGPATFDTTPGGPNDPAINGDMLIGHGNVLLLEDDWYSFAQTVPGFFDVVTDDPHGGDLIFQFLQPVDPRSVLLADINPPPNLGASVTLIDANGRTRVYAVEPGWTGGYGNAGPHELDLTTTAPQPGNGTPRFATATEEPGFLQGNVVQIVVHMTGYGALDELSFALPRASATTRNGSGTNATILRARSRPVLGSTWRAELDCSAYGSGLATLVMRRGVCSGTMTPIGELLIAGELFSQETRLFAASASVFHWVVPHDMALVGLDLHVQGSCQEILPVSTRGKARRVHGGLSNALDLVLGF